MRAGIRGLSTLAAYVLIRGTGLTMIDTVLSLRARWTSWDDTAYSRRGLLPRAHIIGYRPHLASEELKKFFSSRDFRLSQALRVIRNECRDAEAAAPTGARFSICFVRKRRDSGLGSIRDSVAGFFGMCEPTGTFTATGRRRKFIES